MRKSQAKITHLRNIVDFHKKGAAFMSVIERIVQILEEKHLDQSDLCKTLHIRDSTFSTWKSRKTDPPAKYILLICEYLNVSAEYLLGGTDYQNAKFENVHYSNIVNGINGDNSPMTVSQEYKKLDETTQQLVEAFQNLNFFEKAKVMNLIAELSGV